MPSQQEARNPRRLPPETRFPQRRALTVGMKTAILIPDKLFRAGERAARQLGVSRSALYQRALAAFLERHNDRLATEALDEVYGG